MSGPQELGSPEAEARRCEVSALRDLPPPGDPDALLTALADGDWRVRKEAIEVSVAVAASWSLAPRVVAALAETDDVGLRNATLEVLERLGPSAVDALLDALETAPASARKFVVAALGSGGSRAIDALASVADEEEPNTAQAALEALARVGGPRAAAVLRAHLGRAHDPVARLAILEGLERMGAPVTVGELDGALRDRLLRRAAIRLLGHLQTEDAAPILIEALEGPARVEAAEALALALARASALRAVLLESLPGLSVGARDALLEVARDGGEAPRSAATLVALFAREERALAPAVELAAEDRLPEPALEALRAWGRAAVAPLLRAAAQARDTPRGVALELAADLCRLEPAEEPTLIEEVREALREALEDDEDRLAASAARGLGTLAEAEDAGRLASAAMRGGAVARAASEALVSLAEQAPEAVERALAGLDLEGTLGPSLLPVLARVGGAGASDRLQAALSADDPRARRAAVLALTALGGARAAELASFALADEDVDVQLAAVQVLRGLRDEAGDLLGAASLRLTLQAEFEPVVAAAARALGGAGDLEAAATLVSLAREGGAVVAVAAIEALAALEVPALVDTLAVAVARSEPEVVKAALKALASGGDPEALAPALEHEAWDVRLLVVNLLAPLEGGRPMLEARRAVETDDEVRDALERALSPVEGGG